MPSPSLRPTSSSSSSSSRQHNIDDVVFLEPGLGWQTTWRSAKNGPKKAKIPSSPASPTERGPVSVATEMSTDSGDELNLRHLQCSRDNMSLHDHGDVHNREETATAAPPRISAGSGPWALVEHNNGRGTRPAQQGHRPPGNILRD